MADYHLYECDTPRCGTTEEVDCSTQWHGNVKLPRGWSRSGEMDLCDGCTEEEARKLQDTIKASQRVLEES